MRHLKTLGLGLVAMLALSAAFASAASATEFTAASYPATITGSQEAGQENFFQVGGLKTECESATFHGTLASENSTLSITPTYKGCFTSIGTEAPIDFGSCSYLFHIGAGTTGEADLVCPSGDVKITGGLCTIHVPAQTGISGITYTNVANGDVTVDVNSSDVTVNVTRNSFFCPLSSGHQFGKYVSKVLIHANTNIDVG